MRDTFAAAAAAAGRGCTIPNLKGGVVLLAPGEGFVEERGFSSAQLPPQAAAAAACLAL